MGGCRDCGYDGSLDECIECFDLKVCSHCGYCQYCEDYTNENDEF